MRKQINVIIEGCRSINESVEKMSLYEILKASGVRKYADKVGNVSGEGTFRGAVVKLLNDAEIKCDIIGDINSIVNSIRIIDKHSVFIPKGTKLFIDSYYRIMPDIGHGTVKNSRSLILIPTRVNDLKKVMVGITTNSIELSSNIDLDREGYKNSAKIDNYLEECKSKGINAYRVKGDRDSIAFLVKDKEWVYNTQTCTGHFTNKSFEDEFSKVLFSLQSSGFKLDIK